MPLNSEEIDTEGPTPIRHTLMPHYIFPNEASEMTLKKEMMGDDGCNWQRTQRGSDWGTRVSISFLWSQPSPLSNKLIQEA